MASRRSGDSYWYTCHEVENKPSKNASTITDSKRALEDRGTTKETVEDLVVISQAVTGQTLDFPM